MSYCLNPTCDRPENSDRATVCQHCGTVLLLAGRYQPLALIGAGGFGRTLRARDRQKPSQPLCAIKQFDPQGRAGAQKAVQLFQQEAVRLEQLGHHPQIPALYAHCEQAGRQYIVQELIDGLDLKAELQARGPWSEAELRALLADLLPVLQFIHAGNVIHRDIKPENIIRCRDRQLPVLVDFGAAKYATQSALGQTGTAIGSLGYLAPEQQFGKACFASDLYSLAVTCLHLLAGVEPLELYRVEEGSWAWRDRLPAPVSDSLGQILDKLLERAVRHRYQSAAEVLQALDPGAIALPAAPPPRLTLEVVSTRTLTGHAGAICALAFSSDGDWLASGSTDCTLNLWRRDTVWQVAALTGHRAAVKSVAFSPNGKLLASGGLDGTVRVWIPGKSRPLVSLAGHAAGVMAIAFSPDGRLLVSGSADGTVKLWRPNQAGLADSLTRNPKFAAIWSLAFSPDGEYLATGSASGWLHLWSVARQELVSYWRAHSGPLAGVTGLAFTPDGQGLVSSSQDRSAKLWQATTGAEVAKLAHPQAVRAIALSSNGQFLASGGDDGRLRLWRLAAPALLGEWVISDGAIAAVAFSPDGQFLASGGAAKVVRLGALAAPIAKETAIKSEG